MSFLGLLVHDVWLVTPDESTDDYNNVVRDWGAAATRTTSRAWVTQTATSEDRADRETPAARWVCFLPVGTVVTNTMRIEWGDYAFEVDGLPLVAWSSAPHHVEVPLRFAALVEAGS